MESEPRASSYKVVGPCPPSSPRPAWCAPATSHLSLSRMGLFPGGWDGVGASAHVKDWVVPVTITTTCVLALKKQSGVGWK